MILFPKPYADAVARLRVPSGFLIVIVFAWFSRPTPASMAIGVPLSLLGLALRAWAAGCLAKNRHPSRGQIHVDDEFHAGTSGTSISSVRQAASARP